MIRRFCRISLATVLTLVVGISFRPSSLEAAGGWRAEVLPIELGVGYAVLAWISAAMEARYRHCRQQAVCVAGESELENPRYAGDSRRGQR